IRQYYSNFENITVNQENWTTGGGWLRKKTYHTRITTITGLVDFYTHTLKADHPVAIEFLQGPDNPSVDVYSRGDIYLQGELAVPVSGTIDLTSVFGSVTQTKSSAIFGANPTIDAQGPVVFNLQGGLDPNAGAPARANVLNVTTAEDVRVILVSESQTSSIVVGQVESTHGDVILQAADGITAYDSTSYVKGNWVELYTKRSGIGSADEVLRVDSNKRGGGGLAARADGDIYLRELAGDLRLIQPIEFPKGVPVEGAVHSINGDVRIEVVDGSIIDAFDELFDPGSRIDADNLGSILQDVVDRGLFSLDSLRYPLAPGLYKLIYPHAGFLGTDPAVTTQETPNVIGNNVTLVAGGPSGQIGQTSTPMAIDMSVSFSAVPGVAKEALSHATAQDVVGMSHAIYQFLGTDQIGVDLTQEDFSDTARWQKITPDYTTGVDDTTPQVRDIATGKTVLVQFNNDDYGMYRYIAGFAGFDLAREDFRDITRWELIVGDHATNEGGMADLVTGELVTNRFELESLVVQIRQDIDVEVANTLTVDAADAVAISTENDLLINHVRAGGPVQLISPNGAITDLYIHPDAAVSAFGDVQMIAGTDIQGVNPAKPFRTQVAAPAELYMEANGEIDLLQISQDLTISLSGPDGLLINEGFRAIDDLYLAKAATKGQPGQPTVDSPIKVEVSQGNLILGKVSSVDSVWLIADNDILDAYDDANRPIVNIFTGDLADPATGDILLQAGGNIGSAANFLDVEIRKGTLTSTSGLSTFIHARGSLNILNVTATAGDVNLDVDGTAVVEVINSLVGDTTVVAELDIVDWSHDAAAEINAINIHLTSEKASVGDRYDAIEINTSSTAAGMLSAQSANDITLIELSGALVLDQVLATAGNVQLTVHETAASGEDLTLLATGSLGAAQGSVTLQVADDVMLVGAVALTRALFIRGDYRNSDPGTGSRITLTGTNATGSVEITGGSDDDELYAGNQIVGMRVHGGGGDDSLFTGSGADLVFGEGGVDIIDAGAGDDLVVAGSGVGDHLIGGEGNDRIIGSDDGSETDPDFNDGVRFGDFIDGGAGDDLILGLGGADRILGGSGLDLIDAGDGSDQVLGGDDDDEIYAGKGLADELLGEAGNDLIFGSDQGNDLIQGGAGDDELFGQGGDDEIRGGLGSDIIDGGFGTDRLFGDEGEDILRGGGGDGDLLVGGDQDDQITGSDDGADQIFGDGGHDRIWGLGGNDFISGGLGDDIIDAGAGDDQASGDGGSDVILGGADHDLIYGLNAAQTGADSAVDYLYGDFGTNGGEAGSGQDRLIGHLGVDLIFGEAGDDWIDANADGIADAPGVLVDFLDYGTGEAVDPTLFVVPPSTLAPLLQIPAPGIDRAGATLPTGVDHRGRWAELAGSASGLGLSGGQGISTSPTIAMSPSGPIVAWMDTRYGREEIYVAQHLADGWQELTGSASGGGISDSAGASRNPSIALDDLGRPMVAWSESHVGGTDIQVAVYDATANGGLGGWVALGNSLDATGISATGMADGATIINSSHGPVVAWLDDTTGTRTLHMRAWDGAAWAVFGAGLADGTVVVDAEDYTLAGNPVDGRIALSWNRAGFGVQHHAFVTEFLPGVSGLTDGTWSTADTLDTLADLGAQLGMLFDGINTDNTSPTLAYHNGELFAAWQAKFDEGVALIVARDGSGTGDTQWQLAHSETVAGFADQPQLLSANGRLQLLWLNTPHSAESAAIYARQWNGTGFIEEVPGDATDIGVSFTSHDVVTFAAALDANGNPGIAWQDAMSGSPEIYARTDLFALQNLHTATDSPGSRVQDILDANTLGAGDVIVISGVHSQGFSVGPADAGVTIIGASGSRVDGPITIQPSANNVLLQRLDVTGSVTVQEVNGFTLTESRLSQGLTLEGGNNAQVTHNTITGSVALSLTGSVTGALIENNTLDGTVSGVLLSGETNNRYSDELLALGPIAYWRLDEGGGNTALDASGNGYHGTYVNGVALGQPGPLYSDSDTAIGLDGNNDRVELPATALDGVDDVTAVAWVRTTEGHGQAILSGANSGNANEYLLWLSSPTRFHLYTGENNNSNVYWDIPSVADGQWHMFTVVRNGTQDQAELFLDGISQGIKNTTLNTLHIETGGLIVGQEQDSVGGGFNVNETLHGGIDELALFHGILDAAQIEAIYQRALSGPDYLNAPGGVTLATNRINGHATGIGLLAEVDGVIRDNDVTANTTALSINQAFTGTISGNDIHGADTGIAYRASAALSSNEIFDNTTGVVATVEGDVDGFGFVGITEPNAIHSNDTGVELTGRMQNQHVHDNLIGVSGSGVLGGEDLDLANRVEANGVGVTNFTGSIQYNRIAGNTTSGIQAAGGQQISHNLIYRNGLAGILADGVDDVRIVSNTLYTATGDNIRIVNGASRVEVRGNILWADFGYDLYIDNQSRTGFFSDYNLLYAEGSGALVRYGSGEADEGTWENIFTDVLDWQMDVARFDIHSIGRTAIDPEWAKPDFLDRARDDFRVQGLTAGLRFTSPSIDSGDPRTDQSIPADYANLLTNPDFESDLTGWTTNVGASLRSATPVAHSGSQYFFAGNVEEGFAEQSVDLLAAGYTAGDLDSGDLDLVFGGRAQSHLETPLDSGRIELRVLDGGGGLLVEKVIQADNSTDRWALIGERFKLPVGARSVVFRFVADRDSGTGNNAYLDQAFIYLVDESLAPNLGAYGNTPAERAAPEAHIAVRFPDLYTDWERDQPLFITWDSYGNLSNTPVRIDLLQDTAEGPVLLTNLVASTPDDGEFLWFPDSSAIDFGTHGLRIQVSQSTNPAVFDRSTEAFSVPEDGTDYYADDNANSGDVYTPTTTGSNRFTGKTPDAPKPYAGNILRTYSLGAGDTIHVDTGLYGLFDPLRISGTTDLGFGLDEGFLLQGALSGEDPATRFAPAFSSDRPTGLVELDNADFVTLANLSLQRAERGLWVHNSSDHFAASHLTTFDHSVSGIQVASFGPTSFLDHLHVYSTGSTHTSRAVDLSGQFGGITNSRLLGNTGYGLYLTNTGDAVVQSSEIANNRRGIYVQNSVAGTTTLIGSTDISAGLGNLIHDNRDHGVNVPANVQVSGNSIYGHVGTNLAGILMQGGTASYNAVYGNSTGISGYGTIAYNRAYHNTGTGIAMNQTLGTAQGNVVYDNAWGITFYAGYYYYTGSAIGNLVYDNPNGGILFNYGDQHQLVNNTIHQSAGNAIRVQGGTNTVGLRNNILWVEDGTGISVTDDSQVGFTSDYNLFHITGGGVVGNWQGLDWTDLNAWRAASFTDTESQEDDPLFVGPAGPDGTLGFDTSVVPGSVQLIDNTDLGSFSTVGTWISRTGGLNNEQLYSSGAATATWTFDGLTPGVYRVAATWSPAWSGYDSSAAYRLYDGDYYARVNYQNHYSGTPDDFTSDGAAWENLGEIVVDSGTLRVTLRDENSGRVLADAVRIERLAGDFGADDDFHLQSLYGSFHGGQLAPTVDPVSGLPVFPAPTETLDDNQSPAIDRGDAVDTYGNEPLPSGGFINLGAFGNTDQASKSPAEYVLVLSPNGGEGIPTDTDVPIRWRAHGFDGSVDIAYSTTGPAGSYTSIAADEANDGEYLWNVDPASFPASDQYVIRISATVAPAINDMSDNMFRVTGPITVFYVNDGSLGGDEYATAIGDDLNDGLSPSTPKASLRAMLDAYDFEPGDTILVDTGVYDLTTNIT
ncbi:MAG: hypothetical protein GY724_07720, partial [Actinomycetia bacterium]|nr:hypothetical protein [Actinomycetes bacterium]